MERRASRSEIGSRAEIFQAQGMVTVQLGVTLTDALARLRDRAYADNRPLLEVARDIVTRRLRLDRDGPGPPASPDVKP